RPDLRSFKRWNLSHLETTRSRQRRSRFTSRCCREWRCTTPRAESQSATGKCGWPTGPASDPHRYLGPLSSAKKGLSASTVCPGRRSSRSQPATWMTDEGPTVALGEQCSVFSLRVQKWWMNAPAKQHKVERLIAILAGSHGVILGDWDVDVRSGYGPNGDVFPLVDPADDDPRKIKGMRLVGVSGQSG